VIFLEEQEEVTRRGTPAAHSEMRRQQIDARSASAGDLKAGRLEWARRQFPLASSLDARSSTLEKECPSTRLIVSFNRALPNHL